MVCGGSACAGDDDHANSTSTIFLSVNPNSWLSLKTMSMTVVVPVLPTRNDACLISDSRSPPLRARRNGVRHSRRGEPPPVDAPAFTNPFFKNGFDHLTRSARGATALATTPSNRPENFRSRPISSALPVTTDEFTSSSRCTMSDSALVFF